MKFGRLPFSSSGFDVREGPGVLKCVLKCWSKLSIGQVGLYLFQSSFSVVYLVVGTTAKVFY